MVEVEESNIEAGYNNNISSRRYTETNIENSKETYKQQRQRRKRDNHREPIRKTIKMQLRKIDNMTMKRKHGVMSQQ